MGVHQWVFFEMLVSDYLNPEYSHLLLYGEKLNEPLKTGNYTSGRKK